MIVLTGAGAHLDDRICLINPLHMVCVGSMSTQPWLDTPEAQKQHDNIQIVYPGARSEILLTNGRAVFVRETPSEILATFKKWAEHGMFTARDVQGPLEGSR